jgi:predicted NUDIX family phosphoesterase
MSEQEKVLVFPTNKIAEIFGEIKGFKLAEKDNVDNFFDKLPDLLSFLPRSEAETNPEFVQVIPYCVLLRNGYVFAYSRGKSGGEDRLHAKLSLGIGGHLNDVDNYNSGDFSNTYETGLKRELAEEVGLGGEYRDELVGFIYDDSNDVGRVHFGVVHLITVAEYWEPTTEKCLEKSSFFPVSVIRDWKEKFENWSQLVITNLMEKH